MPQKGAPSKTKTQEVENTADTSSVQEGSEGPDEAGQDKDGEDVDDGDGIVRGTRKAADADAYVSIRQHTSAYGIVGGKWTAAEAADAKGTVERREPRVPEPQAHDLPHSSSYQNFVKGMAAELRITEPELKGQAKMQRLGQLWQGLSVEQDASPPKKRRGSPPKPKSRKDDEDEERTSSTGITDDDVVASWGGRWGEQFKSTTRGCHARWGGEGGGGEGSGEVGGTRRVCETSSLVTFGHDAQAKDEHVIVISDSDEEVGGRGVPEAEGEAVEAQREGGLGGAGLQGLGEGGGAETWRFCHVWPTT